MNIVEHTCLSSNPVKIHSIQHFLETGFRFLEHDFTTKTNCPRHLTSVESHRH